MTPDEIKSSAEYKYHHSASRRGYLSRRGGPRVEHYKGRFGTGYVIAYPRHDTTQYINIEYYIKKGDKHNG